MDVTSAPPAPAALSPEAASLVKAGDVAFLDERFDEAETLYRRAIAITPGAQSIAEKAEASSTAVLIGIYKNRDDPQCAIFDQLFRPEVLLGGPRPGNSASADFSTPHATLGEEAGAAIRAAVGEVITAVASPIIEAVVHSAGKSGVVDSHTHLTTWYQEDPST